MPLVRWDRPRGVVHDVAKALAYGNGGCNVLVVSDAALYAIQNLVGLDLEFKARWADELLENGYIPISDLSANYEAWHEMVLRIQAECVPMTCDLTEVLTTLADNQAATNTALAEITQALADIQAGLVFPDNSAALAAIQATLQNQDLCCGPLSDTPYWPENPVETTNPETSTFCDRAWSVAKDWNDAAREISRKAIAGETLGMAVLALILALFAPPVSLLLAIFTLLSQFVLDLAEEDLADDLNALVAGIACAIYSSSNSTAAKSAVDAVILAGPYPEGMPALAIELLQKLLTVEALNKVFDETYTIRADSSGSDCETCTPGCEEELLLTAQTQPWNVVDYGGPVEQSGTYSPSGGWRTNGTGAVDYSVIIGFTTGTAVSSVRVEAYLMANGSQRVTHLDILSHPGHAVLASSPQITVSAINPASQFVTYDLNVSLQAGTRYDLRMREEPINSEVWIHRIVLCKLT